MNLQILKTCRCVSISLRYHRLFNTKPLIRKNILETKQIFSHKRTLYGFFRKPTIDELKVKDDVPDYYNLIYKSRMKDYFLFTQILTTSSACIYALILSYTKGLDHLVTKDMQAVQNPDEQSLIALTLFISLAIGVQYFLSRVPIRIYNFPQKQKYILVSYGYIPLTMVKYECKVGDVIELERSESIIPWSGAKYLLKTKNDEMKITLFIDNFRRPADLYIMMGVQSDPDVEEDEKLKDDKYLETEDHRNPKEEK